MNVELEAFGLADRIFFDSPARWDPEGTAFPATTLPVPDGWRQAGRDVWLSLQPPGPPLPPQGWKIHVSACPDNAERVMDKTWQYCTGANLAFKMLRSRNAHRASTSKYAARSGSGKLITIYPRDERELERALEELAATLSGEHGPYVLSDLRIGDGPLYVRYGGFTARYCLDDDGMPVHAIARPDGSLTPDLRRPVFEVPSWVTPPEVLRPHLAARAAAGQGSWGYTVRSALHFSNGGGVYQAERNRDGRAVVLKEARPLAGLDEHGRDAVARLDLEEAALRRLRGIPGVPVVHERLTVWEHSFLSMDVVPGITAQAWVARHYPFTKYRPSPADISAFATSALRITSRLERLVEAIHARGMVFGDLHPGNILIGPDEQVGLVDFEVTVPVEDAARQVIGYPGFVAPGKRGFAVDRHALAAFRLWLFLPLTSLLALAPDLLPRMLDEVDDRFGLPATWSEPIVEELLPC